MTFYAMGFTSSFIFFNSQYENSTHKDSLLGFFDGSLSISFHSVGHVKGGLKFVDVLLKFLLDAKSLSLTLGLCVKTGLDRLNGTLVVAARGGKINVSVI